MENRNSSKPPVPAFAALCLCVLSGSMNSYYSKHCLILSLKNPNQGREAEVLKETREMRRCIRGEVQNAASPCDRVLQLISQSDPGMSILSS